MGIALLELLGKFAKFLIKYRGKLPSGSAGIYIVVVFFYNLFTSGLSVAISKLSTSIFATEWTIRKNVELAINNSPNYGLFQLFEIIMAIMIFVILLKFIAKVLVGITGSQALWGAYFVALIIVGILEIGSIKIVSGQWNFIPIWDGIIYLLIHIKPVLINAIPHFVTVISNKFAGNSTNITVNSTNTTNTTTNITANITNVTNGTI